MILQSLRALALREQLVSEPAFESKGVTWMIKISHAGQFLSLQSTLPDMAATPNGKKLRPQPTMMSIPRRVIRTGSKIKADFLCDKAEYVFGAVPEGTPLPKSPAKPENCRKTFLEQMEFAAQEASSPLLHAALAFLQSDEQRAACVAKLREEKDWASNDLFVFSCEGRLLHNDPAIRQWWTARQQIDVQADAQLRQCLICGTDSIPVENHDKLKVPGGMSAGVPLVSFNADSFLKYGLPAKENAPICRPCMTAYVEGMRRCLNERYPSPHNAGEMMGRQSIRLTPDTTAVYWTDIPWQLSSGLALLLNQPEDLEATLRSPHKGRRTGEVDGTFYCIILSGSQGRAMLRSVHTGTVRQVELSLKNYFDALMVEGSDATRRCHSTLFSPPLLRERSLIICRRNFPAKSSSARCLERHCRA